MTQALETAEQEKDLFSTCSKCVLPSISLPEGPAGYKDSLEGRSKPIRQESEQLTLKYTTEKSQAARMLSKPSFLKAQGKKELEVGSGFSTAVYTVKMFS